MPMVLYTILFYITRHFIVLWYGALVLILQYSKIRSKPARPVIYISRASLFFRHRLLLLDIWIMTIKKISHTSILITLYYYIVSSSRCPQGRRRSSLGGGSGVRRSISCLITPAPLSSILTIHPVDTIHCIPIILIILLVVPLVMELEEV